MRKLKLTPFQTKLKNAALTIVLMPWALRLLAWNVHLAAPGASDDQISAISTFIVIVTLVMFFIFHLLED